MAFTPIVPRRVVLTGLGAQLVFHTSRVSLPIEEMILGDRTLGSVDGSTTQDEHHRAQADGALSGGEILVVYQADPTMPNMVGMEPEDFSIVFPGNVPGLRFHGFVSKQGGGTVAAGAKILCQLWLQVDGGVMEPATPEKVGDPPVELAPYVMLFHNYVTTNFPLRKFTSFSLTCKLRFSIGWPDQSEGRAVGRTNYLVGSLNATYSAFFVAFYWTGSTMTLELWYRKGGLSWNYRSTQWPLPDDTDWHEIGVAMAGNETEIVVIDGAVQTPVATTGTVGVPYYSSGIGVFYPYYSGGVLHESYRTDHVFCADLRIWDDRLTEAELISQAGGADLVRLGTLYGAWDFAEQAGRYAADRSGNSRNLDFQTATPNIWPDSDPTKLNIVNAYNVTLPTSYRVTIPSSVTAIARGTHPQNKGKLRFEVKPVSIAGCRALRFGIANNHHRCRYDQAVYPGYEASAYLLFYGGDGIRNMAWGSNTDGTFGWDDTIFITSYGFDPLVWTVFLDFTGAAGSMRVRVNSPEGSWTEYTPPAKFSNIDLVSAWYPIVGTLNTEVSGVIQSVDFNFGQEDSWAPQSLVGMTDYLPWAKVENT